MTSFQNVLLFLDVRTALLSVFVLLVLRWFLVRPKNLPPGPWGLPIIGSILAIARGMRGGVEPHILFCKYAAKYGPVFHLKIFNKNVVVLNDYASVKEAFQHPQLNDRPHMLLAELYKSDGPVMMSGEPWVELRRFCLTVLRSFGIGKSSFEEQIGTEAEELIKEFSALDGKSFNPKHLLGNAVSNVICAVIFGKRYEYTDDDFRALLKILERNFELIGAGGAVILFPALRYLPFMSTKELESNIVELTNFLNGIISNHRASFDADDLKDFTDAYLMEMKNNMGKDKSEVKHSHVNEQHFVGTIANLFGAGAETTATALQWFLLYMAVYPDIQKRVQDEIDAVVGRNRLPRMADKPELNFTRAVIWEVQRLNTVAPLGLAHAAASDTKFGSFLIPKGSFLVPNLWATTRDPKVWPEPDEFKPERFLNDKGVAVQADELITFGVGRRSCIGEHLAKMELFIFSSYFLHQFTFKKPDNSPPLSLKGVTGFIYSPMPFELCATKRD